MSGPLGEVAVTLRDGRKLVLQFDYEAFVRAEKSVPDCRLSDLLPAPKSKNEAARPPSMEAVRALVFGSLYAHHAEISQAELGQLMLPNLTTFIEALGKGMTEAFGADEGEADDGEAGGDAAAAGPRRATHSTGTRSKRSGRA